jgi:hypothetical protein
MNRVFLLAICFVFLTGCWDLSVGPATPKPNVMLAQSQTPSQLVLASSIQDAFTIPSSGSVNSVPVSGWRSTLEYGFHSAFPTGSPDGRRLELLLAELAFGAAGVGMGGTAAVRASIRFKARLLDRSGGELAVLAGTAIARDANTSASPEGMTANASQAVEVLYEKLATDLLSK